MLFRSETTALMMGIHRTLSNAWSHQVHTTYSMRRANGGAVLSLVVFLLTWDSAAAAGGSPIEKTVSLITQLQGSLVSDGEMSQAAYKKYFEWCDQSTTEKRHEVKQTSKV